VNGTNTPTVFIIILNWNGEEDTLACLDSVDHLGYASRYTVVVDNGSTDDSVKRIAGERPDVTLIEHKVNLGYTGGNNAGIRYALAHGAEYVWLLNNDTLVEADSLGALVAAARRDPMLGLLSPLTYDYHHRERLQFWGILADAERQEFIRARDPRHGESSGELPLLWGTALLINASVIRQIGYLDERYFAYHEDVDYSLRAIAAGFRTRVEPAAIVYHKWAASSGVDSPFRAYLYTRNWYLFWRSHSDIAARPFFVPRYLAWALGQAAAFKEKGNLLTAEACLDGAWSALRGCYGPPTPPLTLPKVIKRILCAHPHAWSELLRGEVRNLTGIWRRKRLFKSRAS